VNYFPERGLHRPSRPFLRCSFFPCNATFSSPCCAPLFAVPGDLVLGSLPSAPYVPVDFNTNATPFLDFFFHSSAEDFVSPIRKLALYFLFQNVLVCLIAAYASPPPASQFIFFFPTAATANLNRPPNILSLPHPSYFQSFRFPDYCLTPLYTGPQLLSPPLLSPACPGPPIPFSPLRVATPFFQCSRCRVFWTSSPIVFGRHLPQTDGLSSDHPTCAPILSNPPSL